MDWLELVVDLVGGLVEGLLDAWPWGEGRRRKRRKR